jgi:NAD(P)-dependent dehydrogenase (short-subunit alcohol dehydrogenase family)
MLHQDGGLMAEPDGILEQSLDINLLAPFRLSKWAVSGMTMLQAKEPAGVISVNAFDPGWIRTDLGGPDAPGTPQEAADGLRKTLLLPWDLTGRFFKDGEEIAW